MTVINHARALQFSDEFVEAQLVNDVSNFRVEDGIVVNLSTSPMIIAGEVPGVVPAWKSTILRGGTIEKAERVAIFRIPNTTNLGGLVFRDWEWFGNRFAKFPRTTPLYISKYDAVGNVSTDPYFFSNQSTELRNVQTFGIRLNLWWAPAATDCFIHNEHPFLEIHTQIHGTGRMQKFAAQNDQTLFEEVVMPPGYTHDPFAHVTADDAWEYPWHRYYSDTDCIWLAIELHPAT